MIIINQSIYLSIYIYLSHSDSSDLKLKIALEENDKLRREHEQMKQTLDTIHIRFKQLSENFDIVKNQKTKLEQVVKDLQEQLHNEKDNSEAANKKAMKLKLALKDEVERAKNNINNSNNNNNNNSLSSSTNGLANSNNNNDNNNMDSKSQIKKEPNSDSSSNSNCSSDELEEVRILAKSRLTTIEKYQEERVHLVAELERLKREMAYIPDDRIAKTRIYTSLAQQLLYTSTELDNSRAHADRLEQRVKVISESAETERVKILRDELSRRETLEKNWKESEYKLAKMRAERDTFEKKLEHQTSTAVSPQLIKELRTMLDVREAEVKRMKEQVDHLKDETTKLKLFKEDSKRNQDKLLDSLDEKVYVANR